jgi:hypothetical protein
MPDLITRPLKFFSACRFKNGTTHSSTHFQLWIRSVDNRVYVHFGYIIADDFEWHDGNVFVLRLSGFAGEQEGVRPDFLCLGKGLTGGYLPLAATMTSERERDRLLGHCDKWARRARLGRSG